MTKSLQTSWLAPPGAGFLVVMVATLGTGSGQPGGQSLLRVGYLSDKNRGYEL